LAALGLGGAGLALWTRYLVLGATKNAVADLRMRLLERLHALPAAWSDRHDAALLHATVVQDSERIDVMMADVAARLVPAATLAAYVQANGVIAMVAAAVALVVGGTAVIHGDTTLGSLVSFFALAAFLRGHVNTVVTVVPEVISGAESLERLQSVLRADEPAPYNGTAAPRAALPLVVRDVAFSYDGRTPVLRRANLEIRPGECVAISAPNGAGNSTI